MTTTMIGAIAVAPLLNDSFRPSGVILGASAFLVIAGTIALLGMMRAPSAQAPRRAEPREGYRLAKLLRPGDDVSLITWGDLVPAAERAANALALEVSVEIVALPLEGPWNRTAVLRSVAKTSKVLVLHYDGPDERFAAEVAAVIAEQGFEDLDAPVRRVSVAHDDVVASLRALAKY
jgi:pyruvate/2-oxoglutarate/acetoin dehydrogenase E1 component